MSSTTAAPRNVRKLDLKKLLPTTADETKRSRRAQVKMSLVSSKAEDCDWTAVLDRFFGQRNMQEHHRTIQAIKRGGGMAMISMSYETVRDLFADLVAREFATWHDVFCWYSESIDETEYSLLEAESFLRFVMAIFDARREIKRLPPGHQKRHALEANLHGYVEQSLRNPLLRTYYHQRCGMDWAMEEQAKEPNREESSGESAR
jgi:hypothetical protein